MPLPVKSVDCSSQRLWMTVIRTWRTRLTFAALCGETPAIERGRRGRHEVQARHKRAYSPLAATSS